MSALTPFVYWAQNEQFIYIKVDLRDVKDPKINLTKNRLEFQAKGVGAKGLNDYAFKLDFNDAINSKESGTKITDNRVDFTIKKAAKAWWSRLITQPKPIWLKNDYDRYNSENLLEDENAVGDVREAYPELYEELQRQEFGYKKQDFRLVYLTLYNFFMYVGYMYVVCVLLVRYIRDGINSFPGTCEAVGAAVCFLQLLQILEVLHPLFGYVTGGILLPFLQIGGRLFVLFPLIEFEPRIQTMPVVFYLFLAWSTIEIIRYPYYVSRLLKKENGILTWLRYSAWLICYPIGFICEGVIIFRNLIFIEQSGKWSINLPQPIDYNLRFSLFLRFYLLFLLIPCAYVLMSHMYKLRQKKIGPKKYRRKQKQY